MMMLRSQSCFAGSSRFTERLRVLYLYSFEHSSITILDLWVQIRIY